MCGLFINVDGCECRSHMHGTLIQEIHMKIHESIEITNKYR